jgi:hypothetical protein
MTPSTDDGAGAADPAPGGLADDEVDAARRRRRLTQVSGVVAIVLCQIVGSLTLSLLQTTTLTSDLRVAGAIASNVVVMFAWVRWLKHRLAREGLEG